MRWGLGMAWRCGLGLWLSAPAFASGGGFGATLALSRAPGFDGDLGLPVVGTSLTCLGATYYSLNEGQARFGVDARACGGSAPFRMTTAGVQYGLQVPLNGAYGALYSSFGVGHMRDRRDGGENRAVFAYTRPTAVVGTQLFGMLVETGAYLEIPVRLMQWVDQDTTARPISSPSVGLTASVMFGRAPLHDMDDAIELYPTAEATPEEPSDLADLFPLAIPGDAPPPATDAAVAPAAVVVPVATEAAPAVDAAVSTPAATDLALPVHSGDAIRVIKGGEDSFILGGPHTDAVVPPAAIAPTPAAISPDGSPSSRSIVIPASALPPEAYLPEPEPAPEVLAPEVVEDVDAPLAIPAVREAAAEPASEQEAAVEPAAPAVPAADEVASPDAE